MVIPVPEQPEEATEQEAAPAHSGLFANSEKPSSSLFARPSTIAHFQVEAAPTMPIPEAIPLPPPLSEPRPDFHMRVSAPPEHPKYRLGLLIALALFFAVPIGLGGVAAYVQRKKLAQPISDDAVKARLVGTWHLTRRADGPASGSVDYRSDGTFESNVATPTLKTSIGGSYVVKDHVITLSMDHFLHGHPITPPSVVPLGTVKQITDNKLVVQTDYGDEVYSRP
jgi:hypothetical protein